jgi:hypothetical protein
MTSLMSFTLNQTHCEQAPSLLKTLFPSLTLSGRSPLHEPRRLLRFVKLAYCHRPKASARPVVISLATLFTLRSAEDNDGS